MDFYLLSTEPRLEKSLFQSFLKIPPPVMQLFSSLLISGATRPTMARNREDRGYNYNQFLTAQLMEQQVRLTALQVQVYYGTQKEKKTSLRPSSSKGV